MRIFPGQRCIVGVDESPNSLAALHRAADEAQGRHARLEVHRVLTDEPRGPAATIAEWLRLRALVASRLPTA